MNNDDLVQQLAVMRREIAKLKSQRVTYRSATVTAVDLVSGTFTADVPGAGELGGIAAEPQFMPTVGDVVRLSLAGAVPIHMPGRVGLQAINSAGEPYDVTTYGLDTAGIDPLTGDTLWGTDATGYSTVQGLSVNSDPIFEGTPLTELLASSGTGFYAGASRGSQTDPAATASGGGETGYYEMTAELEEGRIYELRSSNVWLRTSQTSTTRVALNVRYTVSTDPNVDPPAVSLSSPLFARDDAGVDGNNGLGRQAMINKLLSTTNGYAHYRFLVSVYSVGGSAYIEMGSSLNVDADLGFTVEPDVAQLYVVDLGNQPWTNRAVSNGGTTGAPALTPKKRYTFDYYPHWTRTFRGDGSVWGDSGDAYQGFTSYYPPNGNMAAQIGDFRRNFSGPGIASDLAGATIEGCWFWLYAKHWYANAGGTGIVRYHNNTGPGSLNNYAGLWTVGGWARGQGRWINVGIATGNGLRDGGAKGIQVGPAPTTASAYYGYFGGHADSGDARPRIRVTYTK